MAEESEQPYLKVRTGTLRNQIHVLRGSRLTIGRAETNDIALINEMSVSRVHAQLEQATASTTLYVLTDLGSTNGTLVNGKLIHHPQVIKPGDLIGVGDVELVLLVDDPLASQEEDDREKTLVRPNPVRPRPPENPERFRQPFVFISHANEDDEIANQLTLLLQAAGVVVWVDHHQLQAGEFWRTSITDALDSCHAGLVIMSDQALASPACTGEQSRLVTRSGNNEIALFVVLVKDFDPQKLPFDLRAFQYINLSRKFDQESRKLIDAVTAKVPPVLNDQSPTPLVSVGLAGTSYDVVISYSPADITMMRRMRATLEAAGLRSYAYEGEAQPGDIVYLRVMQEAIEHTHCVLVLLSQTARTSIWVEGEIHYAHKKGRGLFLALVTPDSTLLMSALAELQVNLYQQYDSEMQRLIAALRRRIARP